jgi:HlyD family secretion protein
METRMSIRRSLIVLLLIIAILPFVVFTRGNQPQASAGAVALESLQLYEVRRGDIALTVAALGAIEARESVQLAMLTAGRVGEIYVGRDDYVLAGDLLLRLENDLQRIRYEQAVLLLEQAELAYQDVLVVDETAVTVAQVAVDAALGAYYSVNSAVAASDIQAAEIAYQQALSAADAVKRQRDDIGGQFGGDSIEWQTANARYGEATFQAEIARLQIERLRNSTAPQSNAAYARVLQAQAELARVQAGPSQIELDIAQANIDQAESQLEQAQLAYQQTFLYAPFDGIVTALNAESGALVGPGLVIASLTDVSALELTVQVDEIDIGLVEVGQAVRVTLDALPGIELPAQVTQIAPIGTQVGGIVSYDVGIALASSDPRIRVGMTAEATIVIEETTDVLVVPNLYIRRDRITGNAFVNVLRDDNQIEEVAVSIGVQSRDASQIVEGLEEGALVAIDLGGGGLNILGGTN